MEFNLLQHPYVFVPKHKAHHDNGKHPEKEIMMSVFNCANWFWFSFANHLPIPPLWLLFWLLVHFPLPIPPGFRLPEAESIRVCCQFSPELLHGTGAKHRQTSHAALANPPSLFSFPSLFFWFPRLMGPAIRVWTRSQLPITWHHSHPWAVSYFMAPLSFFLYFRLLDGGRQKSFKIQLLWFSEESCW